MASRPHFFIVGAPKCGTTALFSYLSKHPSIFMAPIKDPKFFSTDLRTSDRLSVDAYMAMFANAPEDLLTGEASTLYFYSKCAVERIMAHNPAAKIIVMLRNPTDAAHSLHSARWRYKLENLASFEDAWRAQAERLAGRLLPPGWLEPATLQYGAIFRYSEQMQRVLQWVPQSQRHVIIYEEFFADPGRRFAETLDFLNLAPNPNATYPVVNPAAGPRSSPLDRLLRNPPRWLSGLYHMLARSTGVRPANVLGKLNTVPRPKTPMSRELREELNRYFVDDIADLERLLGRPLWRNIS